MTAPKREKAPERTFEVVLAELIQGLDDLGHLVNGDAGPEVLARLDRLAGKEVSA